MYMKEIEDCIDSIEVISNFSSKKVATFKPKTADKIMRCITFANSIPEKKSDSLP